MDSSKNLLKQVPYSTNRVLLLTDQSCSPCSPWHSGSSCWLVGSSELPAVLPWGSLYTLELRKRLGTKTVNTDIFNIFKLRRWPLQCLKFVFNCCYNVQKVMVNTRSQSKAGNKVRSHRKWTYMDMKTTSSSEKTETCYRGRWLNSVWGRQQTKSECCLSGEKERLVRRRERIIC